MARRVGPRHGKTFGGLARIFIEFVKVHAKWVDRAGARVVYVRGARLQRATEDDNA